MARLTLIALLVFDTVGFAQDTPFAHELRSIDEANLQVKAAIQDAIREGRTPQSDYRDVATQLAELLGPMLWPHELSGPDTAAQASLDGLVRLANAARELSEHGAKYDEVIGISEQVQALIFQANFAIRRAERDARLAVRMGTRDERATQDARDSRRQSASLAESSQRRAADDATHQRRIQESQEAARRTLERQNAANAENTANARRRARRTTRSNRFRRVLSVASNAAPRASRRPHRTRRPRRVNHTQTTTVRTSNGRTRTTTRYRRTSR